MEYSRITRPLAAAALFPSSRMRCLSSGMTRSRRVSPSSKKGEPEERRSHGGGEANSASDATAGPPPLMWVSPFMPFFLPVFRNGMLDSVMSQHGKDTIPYGSETSICMRLEAHFICRFFVFLLFAE